MSNNENMAASFLKLAESHRSVRSFQVGKNISDSHEKKIVETAQKSSSSCNLQTTTFISIKNMDKRRKLTELCGNQEYIFECSTFLVVCADLHKMDIAVSSCGYQYYQSRFFDSLLMGVIDASIAAQTAALAAESMGYGICMIGGLRNSTDAVMKLLELPQRVFPVFGICIGYPDKLNEVKQRIPLKGVLLTDKYDEKSIVDALGEYDKIMLQSGIYKGREKPCGVCARPENDSTEIDLYGWIEHTARRISSHDPAQCRPALRKTLEDAGFGFG